MASAWDEGDTWLASMRHIAAEGRCWVIGAGCSLHTDDIPADVPHRDLAWPGEPRWLNPGDSVVMAPGGEVVAGPLHGRHAILYADIDPGLAAAAHRTLDVAGHYGRPDVFELRIDRSSRVPVDPD